MKVEGVEITVRVRQESSAFEYYLGWSVGLAGGVYGAVEIEGVQRHPVLFVVGAIGYVAAWNGLAWCWRRWREVANR